MLTPIRNLAAAPEGRGRGVPDTTVLNEFLLLPQPTKEQKVSLVHLHAIIEMCNKAVPELRLQLPSCCLSYIPYLSLNFEICVNYYSKCERLRSSGDAGGRISILLTSFLEHHRLEWNVCTWKNDFIAGLMLGEFDETLNKQSQVAEHWQKSYWKREQRIRRKTDISGSPKRVAAESAVLELEMLALMDDAPDFWACDGFSGHAMFVNWLNANWQHIAANKKGAALLKDVITRFRQVRKNIKFSDSDLAEICHVYGHLESSYDPGTVPPYQVVLTLVARRHKVSPRLVSKMRAEQNKRRNPSVKSRKARR